MSQKPLHIVFQVLNFIFGQDSIPYNLTADEEKLLIVLARHKGAKGIYPSIPTLEKELKRHRTNIIHTIVKLELKELIAVERMAGKSNHYFVQLPNEDLSTTSSVHTTSDPHTTRSADTTTPVAPALTTRSAGTTQSIKRAVNINNRERQRKERAAPLTDDFHPSIRVLETGIEYGLTEEEVDIEVQKYFNKNVPTGKRKTREQWNRAIINWVLDAAKHKADRIANGKRGQTGESRSTVKEWGRGHSDYDRINAPRGMDSILNGIGMLNGHGRSKG